MKQEFIELPLVGKINTIYENPSTGIRTYSANYEVLYSLREFTEEVLGKEFYAYNTINGYKQRERDFTFKGGSGYNVLDIDLLGENQPNGLSSVYLAYLRYKQFNKSEQSLSALNEAIKHYNKNISISDKNKKIKTLPSNKQVKQSQKPNPYLSKSKTNKGVKF